MEDFVITGEFRRRFECVIVTDLSLLICFGAIFPPLSFVIIFSVLKDIMSIKLALGRFYIITNSINDIGVRERLLKLRDNMNEDMMKARAEIWNGLWYGLVISSWIWAFVLFDTLSSSVGVMRGLWVLIIMIINPFFWKIIYVGLRNHTTLPLDRFVESLSTPTPTSKILTLDKPATVSIEINPLFNDLVGVEMNVYQPAACTKASVDVLTEDTIKVGHALNK
jgi:hypothetical protein